MIGIDHKAAAFILPSGEIVEEVSGYVIHFFQTRRWYRAKYNPKQKGTPPDCWSPDMIAPSPSSLDVQSKTCATCPMAQFREGNSAPLCSTYTWMFLLNPSWGSPPMACLVAPPSSIRPLLGTRFTTGYFSQCVAKHRVYQIVWTTFRLTPVGDTHCVLEPVMGPAASDPAETRQIASLRNAFLAIMEDLRGSVADMGNGEGEEG